MDKLSGNYGAAGNSTCLINCIIKNCITTQYDRLLQKSYVYNCVLMNNHIVPNNDYMFYMCSLHNYICAGNTYGTNNTPITNITSNYSANYKNVELSSLYSNGRPIKGNPCYGAGNAAYLQSQTDFAGNSWLNHPSIGCFEYVRPSNLPNQVYPFGTTQTSTTKSYHLSDFS